MPPFIHQEMDQGALGNGKRDQISWQKHVPSARAASVGFSKTAITNATIRWALRQAGY